jgi:hypothetical protein
MPRPVPQARTLNKVTMRVYAAGRALDAGLNAQVVPSERYTTAQILIVFVLSLVSICLVVIVVAGIMKMVTRAPDIAALQLMFVEAQRTALRPEPIERAVYLTAILMTVPAVFAANLVARRLVIAEASAGAMVFSGPLILAALGIAVFFDSDLLAYVLGGDISGRFVAGANPMHVLLVTIAALVAAFLILQTTSQMRAVPLSLTVPSRAINTALAFIIVLTVVAGRIRSASMIYGDPHFEAVFYSMSQVMAGKTLLADLPSQYGLYAELLRPVFAIIGFSVLKFTAVMTLLQAIGCLALLMVCTQLLRSIWLRTLAVLTLSLFISSTWTAISGYSFGHEYYQLWPVRLFFPAASLLLFVEGLRRGLPVRWVAGMALFAGVAVVWNLESGIAVVGALIASILIRFLLDGTGARGRNTGILMLSILLPIAVVSGFFAFLDFKSGGTLRPLDWIRYQTIFYSTGFGMLPMPLYPHPWMAVLGLYLLGIVGAVYMRAAGCRSFDWDTMLYLAVMGLGLFTYYQGRSHDVVLTFVIWPAILIAFILANRILNAVRIGSLPKVTVWSAAPVVLFGVLMSLRCLAGVPGLLGTTYADVKAVKAGRSASLEQTVAFIQSRVGSDKVAVILDPGQSILFAEAALASATRGPGVIEMLLKEDEDRLVNGLITSPVRHVFIRSGADGNIPSAYSALLFAYQIVDSEQGMQYLTPRGATVAR